MCLTFTRRSPNVQRLIHMCKVYLQCLLIFPVYTYSIYNCYIAIIYTYSIYDCYIPIISNISIYQKCIQLLYMWSIWSLWISSIYTARLWWWQVYVSNMMSNVSFYSCLKYVLLSCPRKSISNVVCEEVKQLIDSGASNNVIRNQIRSKFQTLLTSSLIREFRSDRIESLIEDNNNGNVPFDKNVPVNEKC